MAGGWAEPRVQVCVCGGGGRRNKTRAVDDRVHAHVLRAVRACRARGAREAPGGTDEVEMAGGGDAYAWCVHKCSQYEREERE